jgi:beta-galactosidase
MRTSHQQAKKIFQIGYMKINLIVLMMIAAGIHADAQTRSRSSFNAGWKFMLDSTNAYSDSVVNDAGWRTLNLPHDWSIEGKFDEKNPATAGGGALPGGTGWYRKTFTVPEADSKKKISIHFDGVYRNSEVWVNGVSIGKRPNGYISFQYDITPYIRFGKQNVIAVKVDNSKQPNSRWYSGSGIYRNVWLVKTNSIHVANWGNFITTPIVSAKQANVHVETKISNESGKEETVQVTTTVYNAAGAVAATQNSSKLLPVADTSVTSNEIIIKEPMLWSVDRPYLYKAVIQIKLNGRLVDEQQQVFGIRYFNLDIDKGFSLNGKRLKILGVCNHHDLGCLGTAVNTRAIERQLEKLKQMGCNGIRTSHNPPAPELLDLCDKMGFIVMDEAFDMWKQAKNPYDYHLDWDEWHERDLKDQLLRDRNHPSIFFWSAGNEIPEQWTDEKKGDSSGRNIARELVNIIHSLDISRPVVTANNNVDPQNKIVQSGAFDVIGLNYHHEVWPSFKQNYPGKTLIVTESVSALETRGHYDLVPMDTVRRWPVAWDKPLTTGNKDFTVSAYDHVSAPWGSTHEESWRVLKNNDHVSGMFIWTGWDYIGEPTPYPWPARSSYFGIIDLAGFPKDVFYMYQSEATSTPVLHVLPHWNWNNGDTVDVVAYYNNADEVELFLNGRSLGTRKKNNDTFHVKWRVPYTAGTLKAVSRKAGKTVMVKQIQTAGAPAKIILSADRNKIKADGDDLSFVTATIVDANGVIVPRADNLVQFSIKGAGFVRATDNGNPVSHESFQSPSRKALNGLALAVVQSNGSKGNIVLTATSEGMPAASVVIESK